jgi:hypothetical protein
MLPASAAQQRTSPQQFAVALPGDAKMLSTAAPRCVVAIPQKRLKVFQFQMPHRSVVLSAPATSRIGPFAALLHAARRRRQKIGGAVNVLRRSLAEAGAALLKA